MKLFSTLFLCFLFCFTLPKAQVSFNSDEHLQYLQENADLSTAELLQKNPRKSIYYSSRLHKTDLKQICWLDSLDNHLKFTDYEKQLLENNHFFVSERLRNRSWAYSFINLYSRDLPLYLSSDFILHTLHASYDAILQNLEITVLEPNLKVLLNAMAVKFDGTYEQYKDYPQLQQSLADVDLYIAVANSLLNDAEIKPRKFSDEVYNKVMGAIKAEQLTSMPLFTETKNRNLDFSQFKPRGHYAYEGWGHNQEPYFKALMWLGRIDFLMTAPPENPWETDWKPEELQRMQMGAILLNNTLSACGKYNLYSLHEKIISFMVGPDDNLSPEELFLISETNNINAEELNKTEAFNKFTEILNSSDDYGQRIMSNFFMVDPLSEDPSKLPVSFKLMGQKFLLDSYFLSEVVYDRINWNGKKVFRGLPDPLDAMAALGNEDALALMENEMETYHYAYKIDALQKMTSHYNDDYWKQSLYNIWLSAIRSLNPKSEVENLPYFMRTTAWHHKQLNTQLFSWAQLRHDNILYGKQSYTGGTGCSYPYTYVEPQVELYQKIADFSSNASDFFNETIGHNNAASQFYSRYGQIMDSLSLISQKELNGEPFSDQELIFLKTMINSYMASGPSITGWYNDLFINWEKAMSEDLIVVDVHTQPTDASGNVVGNILHVGTGEVNLAVILAPNPMNPDQLISFAGPVGSYYEAIQPNFYRLSDREWQSSFYGNTSLDIVAKRPDWTSHYLANSEGTANEQGRTLSGALYTSSNITEPTSNSIDYILPFPNPTKGTFQLRFVCNENVQLTGVIQDINGKTVKKITPASYTAGEHSIPLNIAALSAGTYFVQIDVNQKSIRKKVVKVD